MKPRTWTQVAALMVRNEIKSVRQRPS